MTAASAFWSTRRGKIITVAVGFVAVCALVGGIMVVSQNLANQSSYYISAEFDDSPQNSDSNEPVQAEDTAVTTPVHTPEPSPTPSHTTPPTAQAPVHGTVVSSTGANVRSLPTTKSPRTGGVENNVSVIIECVTQGERISDALGTTDVWYKLANGYVSAAILQPDGRQYLLPSC